MKLFLALFNRIRKDSDSPKFVQKCANPPSQEEIENLNKNVRTIPTETEYEQRRKL